MAKLICGLYEDWPCLDERIETVTAEIEELSRIEPKCQRLMSVPGSEWQAPETASQAVREYLAVTEGATVDGRWQRHTVRGVFSGTLKGRPDEFLEPIRRGPIKKGPNGTSPADHR